MVRRVKDKDDSTGDEDDRSTDWVYAAETPYDDRDLQNEHCQGRHDIPGGHEGHV